MPIKRIGLATLMLVGIATIIFLTLGNGENLPASSPGKAATPVVSDTSPAKAITPKSSGPSAPPQPVPLPLEPVAALSGDMEADDAATVVAKGQVDAALTRLGSPDAVQRVEGAEQLGAYATPEAETALIQALNGDTAPEVRRAAAQALKHGSRRPSEATLNALFTALDDLDETVRMTALSLLEDFMTRSGERSKFYKEMLAGLRMKSAASGTPQDIREALLGLLGEQTQRVP